MHNPEKVLLEVLAKPVDVRRLVDDLPFDLDTLEDASVNQPKLRLRAGRLRIQMLFRKAQLNRRLQAIIGKKSIRIRRRHGNSYTATAIKNELGYDPEVRRAQRKFDAADALEKFAYDITECYKERSMMLVSLGKQRGSEISSEIRSAQGRAEVEALREKARRKRQELERMEL